MRTPAVRFVQSCLQLFLIAAAAWILTGGVVAQGPAGPRGHDRVNGHEAAAGEVIVKYRNPPSASERGQHDAMVDADKDNDLGNGTVRHLHSRKFDAATLVAYFRGAPNVEYAEPNYVLYAIQTPTDPYFPNLWGLLNNGQMMGVAGTPGADIDTIPAWNITTGSAANVVGVVDTGVDYTHSDLAGNIWSAPASFTVKIGGIDYICPAGSHGFNAITNSCDPKDDNNHGTHVSGTIGARANNGVGVAGVNWTTSIMGLKFLDSGGSGSTTAAVNAIEFAIQAKQAFGAAANVRVLSNSWGGGGFSQTLLDEINKANANDMLFVAAAGNSNSNNDSVAFYPANYAAPNVVSVAATDNTDAKASFSSYGATMVDLAAPGVYVLSTTIGNTYAYYSGTSMATPHVSGAAALVLSACAMNTAALKSTILGNVDAIQSMSGITVTGGRLNVYKAITACAGQPSKPPAPTGLSASAGNATVTLQWNASAGATSYNIKRSTASGTETYLNNTSQPGFTDNTAVNGTNYYYTVTALNANGESGNSNEASATPTAPATAPPAPANLSATAGNALVTLQWNGSTAATSYKVKRGTSSGTETLLNTTSLASFTDTTAVNGTKYYYVVTATANSLESGNSNEVSATPAAPLAIPAAPTNLSATAGNASVNLVWNASTGATGYNVKRRTATGSEAVLNTTAQTSFTDSNAVNGTTYYYTVTAVNGAGESGKSNEASATPAAPATAPVAPTNLSAANGPGKKTISLRWNGSSGSSYTVKRSVTSGGPYTIVASGLTTTTFKDTGLLDKTTYYYVVTAVKAGAESSNSNQASARTQ